MSECTDADPALSALVGPRRGGVKITANGVCGVTAVRFGQRPATFVASGVGAVSITVPAGRGSVPVVATTTRGAVDLGVFRYLERGPGVLSVRLLGRGRRGADRLLITGFGFTRGSRVLFGRRAATKLEAASSTSVIATAPAGSGTVDIRVQTDAGTSPKSPAARYTYPG